ncbi:hypothetical protein ACWGH2_29510 [Streptomyces sp. NPDC054871]
MTTIGNPPRSQDDWDVRAETVAAEAERLAAQRKVEASVAKLRYLLAHPAEFAKPSDDAHAAEYSHLLHDADPDSTIPPFVDLTKGTPWRAS